jgi:phosphatidate phosphatase
MARNDATRRIVQVIADVATVLVIAILFVVIYFLVNPYERGFYCNDDTLRYPYKADTVPLWVAGFYGSTSALFVIVCVELYLSRTCCHEDDDQYAKTPKLYHENIAHGILTYTLGAMATMLIAEVGKHTTGRLRPHFIMVCKPKWELIKCYDDIVDANNQTVKIANYIPFSFDLCNGDSQLIREARLSFPSGHSSFSVYSMIFIVIYLEARITSASMHFVKASLQLICVIASWHTCMSRISDHKHHPTDVIAGALIGFTLAVFTTFVTGKFFWSCGNDDSPEDEQQAETNRPVVRL